MNRGLQAPQQALENHLQEIATSGLTRAEAESLVVHLIRRAFEVARTHRIPMVVASIAPSVPGGGACCMTARSGSADYQLLLKLIAAQAAMADRYGSYDQGVPG